MSNEYIKAADDAKRLLAGFKAVATVADAFERVGSLVQAEAEARASLAALHPQIDAAKAELTKLKVAGKARLDEAEVNAGKIIEAAHAKADVVIADARALLSSAEVRVDVIVTNAKTQADAMNAQAAQAAEAVKQAEGELTIIEKKIDDARAKIAKMLGG